MDEPYWLSQLMEHGIPTIPGTQTFDKVMGNYNKYNKVKGLISKVNPNYRPDLKQGLRGSKSKAGSTMGPTPGLNKNQKKVVGDNIDTKNKQENTMSNGEEEIAIAPVPKSLSNVIPDYFTIKMKLRDIVELTTTGGSANYSTTRITMNALNSPFSSNTTYNYMGTSQWKSLFQYYRIIANDITIVAKNLTSEDHITSPAAPNGIRRAIMRVNMEFTDSATARLLDSRQMSEAKHNVSTVLDPFAMTDNYVHTFKHHYEPADFVQTNSHVTNNSEEDRWTAIAANASHPHYLHLTQTYNRSSITTGVAVCQYDITSEITIQFREVTDSILTTTQTS